MFPALIYLRFGAAITQAMLRLAAMQQHDRRWLHSYDVAGVRTRDTMTEEMYEVYTKHGGQQHKRHPLDEAQGL